MILNHPRFECPSPPFFPNINFHSKLFNSCSWGFPFQSHRFFALNVPGRKAQRWLLDCERGHVETHLRIIDTGEPRTGVGFCHGVCVCVCVFRHIRFHRSFIHSPPGHLWKHSAADVVAAAAGGCGKYALRLVTKLSLG